MDNENELEEYVFALTENNDLIENLSESDIDILIDYLQKEIAKKEQLLNDLKKEQM